MCSRQIEDPKPERLQAPQLGVPEPDDIKAAVLGSRASGIGCVCVCDSTPPEVQTF